MFGKIVFLFIVAVCQVLASEQIALPDRNVHYISNPIIGTSLAIPKRLEDTLVKCHATYPDGVMYEVYPNAKHPNLDKGLGVNLAISFQDCSIFIRNVETSASGIYQLMSTVRRSGDNSMVVTTQKFNLKVVKSSSFE